MISAPSVNQMRFFNSSALAKAEKLMLLRAVRLPMPWKRSEWRVGARWDE